MSEKEIGQAIRGARKEMGMTQEEFAAVSGVGVKVLAKIESGQGNMNFSKILMIMSAAGLKFEIKEK